MKAKFTSGNSLITGIVLLLLTILLVTALSFSRTKEAKESAFWVSHTQEVLIHSGKLLEMVLNNETGARGYIATGQKEFLEPLVETKANLYTELTALRTLTNDNAAQQIRIDSISNYIDKRISYSEKLISVHDLSGAGAALSLLSIGQEKIYTDKIRQFLAQMQQTENILLDQRKKINEKNIFKLNSILLTLIIITIIFFLIFIRKLWLDMLEKKANACRLESINQQLDKMVEERNKELLISKNNLEEVLMHSNDGFISLDKNWCYTYINKSAGELLHLSPDSLLGRNVWEVFPLAVNSATYKIFHLVMEKRRYLWNQDYYAPLDLWQENHVYPSGEGISVFIRDISNRKRKEQQLEESNQRFDFVTKATSDAIWDWNLQDDSMYWGAGMETIFGHKLSVSANNKYFWKESIHPDDALRVEKKIFEIIQGTDEKWIDEYRFQKADGSYAFVIDKGFVIRDKTGKVTRMVGAMQDVTTKMKEENRLKLLELFVSNASESMLITEAQPFDDPGPRIVYVNEAFTHLTGYSAEEVIGKTPRILQGPLTDRTELKRLSESIRKWQPCKITVLNYRKDGTTFWNDFSLKPLADEKGWFTHWIAIERDVTKKKNEELQKKLINDIRLSFLEKATLPVKLLRVLEKILDFGSFLLAEAWLVDSESKLIHFGAGYSKSDKINQAYSLVSDKDGLTVGEGLIGKCWDRKTIQHSDIFLGQDNHIWKEASNNEGLKTVYTFPLIQKLDLIGVIVIGIKINENWQKEFESFFESICLQVAAEIKRKQLDQELNQLFSFAPDIICIVNKWDHFTKINPAASELLGYSMEELQSMTFEELVHPDDLAEISKTKEKLIQENKTQQFEVRLLTKTGNVKWLIWTSTASGDGHIFCVAKDITEKKKIEHLLDRASELARIGSWEVDPIANTVYFSKQTLAIHEMNKNQVPDMENGINYYKEGWSREAVRNAIQSGIEKGTPWDLEVILITEKGNERWVRAIGNVDFKDGKCHKLFGSLQDIDARKKAELAVSKALAEKTAILESIGDAFFTVDRNFTVTYWNSIAERELQISQDQIIGKNLWNIFPDSKESYSYYCYQRALKEQEIQQFETFNQQKGCWYEVNIYPSANGLSVYFKDISARKTTELELMKLNELLKKQSLDLSVSNKELEQYAYVASHDLQEPLRMVTSFLGKLQVKYAGSIDEKGIQYIQFAVDGAKRMRQIILDLLDYSLVGKDDDKLERIDLNELVEEIIYLQREKITETNAIIKKDLLPSLVIAKGPIRQVFQNLISNGLKYQRPGSIPEIIIESAEFIEYWQFSVTDNGIGIEPDYFEKIFVIFQRLHNKDDYSGTGIGLAITKKIVQNLGGDIWVGSTINKGSKFYFTIPKH